MTQRRPPVGSEQHSADADMPPEAPTPLRVAVGLLALETLGLVVAAAVIVVKTVTGTPTDEVGALLGAALALAGAAVLGFAARGLARVHPGWRSPAVVLQLLALPIGYTLAFQSGRAAYGAPILLVALATLFLLFTPPCRAVLDREIGRD